MQGRSGTAHLDNNADKDHFILYTIASDPTMIQEALELPGEEGKAWEQAHQAKWQNMVEQSVFGTPAEPPVGTKVLRMGTAHCTNELAKLLNAKHALSKKITVRCQASISMKLTYLLCTGSFYIILALGVTTGNKIRQFDIKLVYLPDMMREEVWLQQLEGFEVPWKEVLSLTLQKALYGTKQGENEWQTMLYEFMHILEWIAWNTTQLYSSKHEMTIHGDC